MVNSRDELNISQDEIKEELAEQKEERRDYFRGFLVVVVVNLFIVGGAYFLINSKNHLDKSQIATTTSDPINWVPASPAKAKKASAYKTPEAWGVGSLNEAETASSKYVFVSKDTVETVKETQNVLGTDDYSPVGLISILQNESDMPLESYDNLYISKSDYDGVVVPLKQIYDVEYRCLQRKDGDKVQISCVAKRNSKDTIYRLNTTTARREDALKSLTGIIEGTDSIGS